MLPAACIGDRRASPHAGSAVEVEEAASAVSPAVLEDEMRVEEDRLDPREQRVVAVEVTPARLDHSHFRVALEVAERPQEEIFRRDEIGVENRNELARRLL